MSRMNAFLVVSFNCLESRYFTAMIVFHYFKFIQTQLQCLVTWKGRKLTWKSVKNIQKNLNVTISHRLSRRHSIRGFHCSYFLEKHPECCRGLCRRPNIGGCFLENPSRELSWDEPQTKRLLSGYQQIVTVTPQLDPQLALFMLLLLILTRLNTFISFTN